MSLKLNTAHYVSAGQRDVEVLVEVLETYIHGKISCILLHMGKFLMHSTFDLVRFC